MWLIRAMEISDVIAAGGIPQRIFCNKCNEHTELVFVDFKELITGVTLCISGLPMLKCPNCSYEQLPDASRFAIVELHRQAQERSSPTVNVMRNKRTEVFNFTVPSFIYDTDDYFYLPGLERQFDIGFLQPVFFQRRVLLKYDNTPGYRLKFASSTYGEIVGETDNCSIAFGINRHGNVVMWLGDIAKLPESEQYYLRSENIASDHSIGSEFYDGQIECIFTPLSKEAELFRLRSTFLNNSQNKFGLSIGHLEAEALDLALSFNPPIVDTPKERKHVADALNKIYLESLQVSALESIIKNLGVTALEGGGLKKLQTILQAIAPSEDIATLLSPLYVLYDFRVESLHLMPSGGSSKLESITKRLGLPINASLQHIYSSLIDGLTIAFIGMNRLVEESSEA